MQVFICFSLKEIIQIIFRENAWGFFVLNSKFELENSDIITLQTYIASCWLDIGIVCHFVYT